MMVELGFPYKFIQWVIECITSVSYSLVLNGGLTEHFQGKRGIRQGARIWEYYTYILLMFCKAEIQSIKLLQKAFLKFSAASRLQANIDKSSIYMTGVKEPFKQQLLQTLSFCEGSLPFKYLGVPLSSKKLTIAQCLPFVGKITEKMKCWYARLLSYASRLQLIKSVIFGVQIYWAQIFILPKRIMKMIDSICRPFLWTGSTEISKKALVSWAKICLPKAAGGHNVLDLCLWNKAAILKHLWALAEKKDCLWIRTIGTWQEEIQLITNWGKKNTGTWAIISSTFAMVVTLVWRERNSVRFQKGSVVKLLFVIGEASRYCLTSSGKYSMSLSYLAMLGDRPKIEEAE
ncbi:uncharacterized protein LOC132609768 [Lycium barbarum]|uniref:uncharacterized protein LOC132609768 n=1 Tax=Lycium barbarum TaxID=112863 RepID=UPI00293F13D5|nr:uncharacterized protein LOC132609768 [Lycium barbarum]